MLDSLARFRVVVDTKDARPAAMTRLKCIKCGKPFRVFMEQIERPYRIFLGCRECRRFAILTEMDLEAEVKG